MWMVINKLVNVKSLVCIKGLCMIHQPGVHHETWYQGVQSSTHASLHYWEPVEPSTYSSMGMDDLWWFQPGKWGRQGIWSSQLWQPWGEQGLALHIVLENWEGFHMWDENAVVLWWTTMPGADGLDSFMEHSANAWFITWCIVHSNCRRIQEDLAHKRSIEVFDSQLFMQEVG